MADTDIKDHSSTEIENIPSKTIAKETVRETKPKRGSGYQDTVKNTHHEPYDTDRRKQRTGFRPFFRKKYCKFCSRKKEINYKDIDTIRRFTTDQGKILPSRVTGNCAKCQRKMSKAIKRARSMAVLPFSHNH